jgi:hypothetical protein
MMAAKHRRRAMGAGAGCAVLGSLAALIGALTDPGDFFPAWLAAFVYWLSLPLGALALLLIHDLTGGKWLIIARVPLAAAAATMPLFILAFLPMLAGLHDLYAWTRPDAAPLPSHWYLNLDAFGLRAAIYFLVWTLLALWRLHRAPEDPPVPWVAALGLIFMGCSVTCAAIDWIMSIEPRWFSSVYGMMVGSGQFIIALASALVIITAGSRATAADEAGFRRHLAGLATILLAVDIFWAYTAYSQWLIIWEENLHSEIPWYLVRLRPFWRGTVLAIVALHLVIPLFTLVWAPAKRSPRIVGSISALLLFAGLLQIWWLVLPPFRATLSWLDPAAVIALGGIWFCLFLWCLDRRLAPASARRESELAGAKP